MTKFYKNPFLRSTLFVPLIIYAATVPWAEFAGNEFKPVYCIFPFVQFTVEKYLPLGKEAKYQQVLQVFVDTPELRELAVPPSMGGPNNQIVFVVEGFALIASLILIGIPVTWIQLIGFIVSMIRNTGRSKTHC